MDSITLNGEEYRQLDLNLNYFISIDGKVYSRKSNKLVKHLYRCSGNKKYPYIDIYVGGKQRKHSIHRLVYHVWVAPLTSVDQVNHIDDNTLNCHASNLYVGTQKENIADSIRNEHRVSGIKVLTVYDAKVNKKLTFCPAAKFMDYCGHVAINGCVNRFFHRDWFLNRYTVIEFRRIKDLTDYESVTTKADECKPVE